MKYRDIGRDRIRKFGFAVARQQVADIWRACILSGEIGVLPSVLIVSEFKRDRPDRHRAGLREIVSRRGR